jgi:hypothetical protein
VRNAGVSRGPGYILGSDAIRLHGVSDAESTLTCYHSPISPSPARIPQTAKRVRKTKYEQYISLDQETLRAKTEEQINDVR